MEYLVNTSGEVSKFHNKTYVVKASTKQEAYEIAKQRFEREFECVKINAEVHSYARTKRAIAACFLMLIAIVISLFTYTYNYRILFFFSKSREFSIAPSMFSCIFAVVFYVVYVIRFKGIRRSVETPIDIAFCVILVLLLSSVFELILTTDNLMFLGFIPLPNAYLVLGVAIGASLLGVKMVSAGCVTFIAITAISNLTVANEAMKIFGAVYVVCAFVGILLYLSVEPAIIEAFPQIKQSFSKTFKRIEKDFSEAKDEAVTMINNIPK